MPLWFIGVLGPYVEPVWQVEQDCVVGMWFAGIAAPLAVRKPPGMVVLVWQVEQSAVVA